MNYLFDPRAWGLTLTNVSLGVAVLAICLAVLRALLLDILDKTFDHDPQKVPSDNRNPVKTRSVPKVMNRPHSREADVLENAVLQLRVSNPPAVHSDDRPRAVG